VEINREQLAWAAGLFEGEGCFSTSTRRTRRPGAPTSRKCAAQINMTDHDVVSRFREVMGFGSIRSIKQAQPHHKPQLKWVASSFEHFQATVALLWPWLGARRRARAKELLQEAREYYASAPAGRRRGYVRWDRRAA
jgi:hypothetical protein